jgi:hypothetical protein
MFLLVVHRELSSISSGPLSLLHYAGLAARIWETRIGDDGEEEQSLKRLNWNRVYIPGNDFLRDYEAMPAAQGLSTG